mmetsp:Transcript_18828/g.38260  ORF Transcript_18828/g.38260 Transcript_18828/m.38260 type:complete len:357 (-) Transcript_18828:13-1083(-)
MERTSFVRLGPGVLGAVDLGDVGVLDGVEQDEHTGSGHTAEDVGSRALEEGGDSLVLHDLGGAVHGSVVGLGGTGAHHHAAADGVDRVGREPGGHGHAVTHGKALGGLGRLGLVLGLGLLKHGHDGVVEAEIEATVDEDSNGGDDEAAVESGDAVGGERLAVDVDESVELASSVSLGRLHVVRQTGTGVVQRVHEGQRARSGETARGDVLGELGDVRVGLLVDLEGGDRLDLSLEGKVQRLGGEVADAVGQVGLPKRGDALVLHDPARAVGDALEGALQGAALDHLVLVLDDHLDALDGSRDGLRRDGGDAGEHEVLAKAELDLLLALLHLAGLVGVLLVAGGRENAVADGKHGGW